MTIETFKGHDEKADLHKVNEIQKELMLRGGIHHGDTTAELEWVEINAAKFGKLITEKPELLEHYDSSDSFKKEQTLSKIEEILEQK